MDGKLQDEVDVKAEGKKLLLNFIDRDEKENPIFNHARLVDILRNYPLLYNKSLESYGDPDYTQWMWGEIANEINDVHRKTTVNLPFSWIDCRHQWQIVKPALRYLSNPAAKAFRYPKQFRDCLEFFQNYIKDRRDPKQSERNLDLFLNYSSALERMPFEKQLALEKKVMGIIMSTEQEICAPMVDPQAIENQAREDFGNVIGLLMPELDVQTVHAELATDGEPLVIDNFVQNTSDTPAVENKPVLSLPQVLVLCGNSGLTLKRPADEPFDMQNLIQPKRVEIIVPKTESGEQNFQYSIEVINEAGLQEEAIQNAIEDDIIEEDMTEDDIIEEDNAEGEEYEECIFPDNAMEDLIEEVVPQVTEKEERSAEICNQFDEHASRLDFVGVLNEILE